MFKTYVAFDFETTGVDADRDRIMQLGAVRIAEGRVVSRWESLVNPGVAIPLEVQRLTGITPAAVADKPPLAGVLLDFLAFLGEGPLVAHNAPFDSAFLAAACRRCHLPFPSADIYDSLALCRLVRPHLASYRLDALVGLFRIALASPHHALADAEAAGLLFGRLLDELQRFDLATLQAAARFLPGVPGGLAAACAWAISRRAWDGPPVEDEAAARPSPSTGAARDPRAAAPPPAFDPQAVVGWLAPGGAVAHRFQAYEQRAGQLQMALAVARTFEAGGTLLAEAGTGTGKTLAYLVPAMAWAAATGERVVISTHTIHLQEQLLHKDIPLLQEALPFTVQTCLVKGRANYLCLLKWHDLLQSGSPAGNAEGFLYARLATWLVQTSTGDRAELNLRREDDAAWQAVAADDNCTGERCRHAARCFFLKARAEAEAADILVINHALLLADVATDRGVLPSYRHLVCDEAHHLPDLACEHMGLTVAERELERLLVGLGRRPAGDGLHGAREEGAGRAGPGFLSRAGVCLAAVDPAAAARVRGILEAVGDHMDLAAQEARAFFHALRHWAAGQPVPQNDQVAAAWRLPGRRTAGAADQEAWSALLDSWRNLVSRLHAASAALSRLADGLSDLAGQAPAPAGAHEAAAEAAAHAQRCLQTASDLAAILAEAEKPGGEHVAWLEQEQPLEGRRRTMRLRMAPLFPGPLLADRLFSRLATCVLTSATLTVGDSFDYMATGLGLDRLDGRTQFIRVPSPFRYREQALVCIPSDLPEPAGPGDERYVAAVCSFLSEVIRAADGGTMVLFTSHRLLREAYQRLRPVLAGYDIALLGQGMDGGRSRLIEAFLAHPRAALFGSATFWEGIDLPGSALRCVVMVRLPFRPPTSPLTEARLEALAARGEDGFRRLSVPEAVIRFKQGFGRLIRTAADRGVVVIMDQRLLTRHDAYGRFFLASLPEPSLRVGTSAQVLESITAWLQPEASDGEGDACARVANQ